jgi:hypothetical protein
MAASASTSGPPSALGLALEGARSLRPERVSQPLADPALDEVAKALRGARARTGMSEQQAVAVLAEQGFKITVTRLRGWERTGVIRVDAASRLASAYGITIDSLAGRRAYRSHHHSDELSSLRPGP